MNDYSTQSIFLLKFLCPARTNEHYSGPSIFATVPSMVLDFWGRSLIICVQCWSYMPPIFSRNVLFPAIPFTEQVFLVQHFHVALLVYSYLNEVRKANFICMSMIVCNCRSAALPRRYCFGFHFYGKVRCLIIYRTMRFLFVQFESHKLHGDSCLWYSAFLGCLWTGCITPDRSVILKALQKGKSILIYPGGENEQVNSRPDAEGAHLNATYFSFNLDLYADVKYLPNIPLVVFIRRRRGFIKLAVEQGINIVPTFVFGQVCFCTNSHQLMCFISDNLFGELLLTTICVCI